MAEMRKTKATQIPRVWYRSEMLQRETMKTRATAEDRISGGESRPRLGLP